MSTGPFEIKRNGTSIEQAPDLAVATSRCQALLAESGDEPTTVTVHDSQGQYRIGLSNRRITGVFIKQRWVGLDKDHAETVESVRFDATHAVLTMDLHSLHALKDRSESTDDLGFWHVQWSGPSEVEVTDSICEYFGVDSLQEINASALKRAAEHACAKPMREVTVQVTVSLKVKVWGDIDPMEVIDEMDFDFTSSTEGALIASSEIIDSECDELEQA